MFLSRPHEKHLWFTIAGLLGVAVLLMLASLQFPWYVVSYHAGQAAEFRGEFDFEDAQVSQYANGQEGEGYTLVYDDDSPFGDLMWWTEKFVGLGIVMGIAYAALLGFYYYGYLEEPKWIKASWIVAVATMVLGIAFFALNAGQRGAEEVVHLLNQHPALSVSSFGQPEAKFWGTQTYANGDLESAPGVGWLLSILAVLNLGVATVLLYQFPERAAHEEEYALEDDDEAAAEGERREHARPAKGA